ncbi:adenine phosphoribosyltransferase [Euzebya sp.]|uniref:adenine phosphoribosyltransferase n=1 Tax=Euzebya sp. TaxID=1971409 RepID=UPI003516CE1A
MSSDEAIDRLNAAVRDVADFPSPGITFKDITPLLADAELFAAAVEALARPYATAEIDAVVGIEARGFIFAAPIARVLGAGFVPLRKAGKLPSDTVEETYDLEYGTATIAVHVDAFDDGDRVLVVDDVLATGGTARAAANLVRRAGGHVVGLAVLIELGFLGGREVLDGVPLTTVLRY